MEAALARVDGKIKTVSDGVSTINSRLASVAGSGKNQSKDLNQKLMMLAILPALSQPTITIPAVTIPAKSINATDPPTAVQLSAATTVTPNPNTMSLMLPILAMAGGGLGEKSDGGSDSSMMMMLALVMIMGQQPRTA